MKENSLVKSVNEVLGFSGRATGLTEAQRITLMLLLVSSDSECTVIHNDGPGADQDFSKVAQECGLTVNTTDSTLTPMARNRNLISICTTLIAAPPTDFLLKKGSGTWETIKYAWKANKLTLIILSDGTIVSSAKDLPIKPIS
jgi:hypothetical protein